MASIQSTALSGLGAAQTQLEVAAGNIANAQTPGYQRRAVVQTPQPQGGVSTQVLPSAQPAAALEVDLVSQLQAKNAFLANLAVFKTSNAMAGAFLNQKV
jgi:flagellar hook protein FlgE